MKKTDGLSPNQEKIMSILEYKKMEIITRDELLKLIKRHMKIKDPSDLIEKLLKKSRLVIIKRGIYMVVPLAAINKKWTLDEYQILDCLLKDKYYIGLYNAFNLHGFTEQIPNKVFVFNTEYSFDKQVLHYKFKFFKIKKEKLFGILTKYKYPYSDRERTIIDALDYPEYLGRLGQVLDIIKKARYNKTRLIDYAIKYNSVKIMKLAGWLTESNKIFRLLKEKKALSYYTTIKKTREEVINKKWKLRLT